MDGTNGIGPRPAWHKRRDRDRHSRVRAQLREDAAERRAAGRAEDTARAEDTGPVPDDAGPTSDDGG
jgi:hypothetical protein